MMSYVCVKLGAFIVVCVVTFNIKSNLIFQDLAVLSGTEKINYTCIGKRIMILKGLYFICEK